MPSQRTKGKSQFALTLHANIPRHTYCPDIHVTTPYPEGGQERRMEGRVEGKASGRRASEVVRDYKCANACTNARTHDTARQTGSDWWHIAAHAQTGRHYCLTCGCSHKHTHKHAAKTGRHAEQHDFIHQIGNSPYALLVIMTRFQVPL